MILEHGKIIVEKVLPEVAWIAAYFASTFLPRERHARHISSSCHNCWPSKKWIWKAGWNRVKIMLCVARLTKMRAEENCWWKKVQSEIFTPKRRKRLNSRSFLVSYSPFSSAVASTSTVWCVCISMGRAEWRSNLSTQTTAPQCEENELTSWHGKDIKWRSW